MARWNRGSFGARAACLVAWAFGLSSGAHAATLRARVDVPVDGIRLAESSGTTRVVAPGLPFRAAPDGAELPMVESLFYVPPGFVVSEVRVTPVGARRLADSARLERTSDAVPDAGPRLASGRLSGHGLQSVALRPVEWAGDGGALTVTGSFDVELDLAPSPAAELVRQRPAPDADAAVLRALRGIVANPGDVPAPPAPAPPSAGRFAPEELPSVDGSAVDYIVLTTDALAAGFQPLADWKTRKGVPTVIRTVEWVDANYPGGADRPERIRNFLRDAYRKWGTYLVLLGGDHHVVEPRHAWSTFWIGGSEIPTDQYYACLDGDWNGNGDDHFGEGSFGANPGDSSDVFPELFVGRAVVEDSTEVATFVAKSFTYDRTPPVGWAETASGLGEVLFPENWEFGVDLPSSITLDGKRLVADSLQVHLPGTWTLANRFQVDGNEDRASVLGELSAGHHMMTIVGHGDAFKFSVGNGVNPLIFSADTDTLTNGDRLTFFNTVACNPNQIDLESQGESLMNNPLGGAIAVLGSTREDFPINSASQSASILRVAFANGVTGFGAMAQLGRLPFAGRVQTDQAADRWAWLSKMLLGDPELRLWTREPEGLVVSHAASVTLGDPTLAVTVTDSLAAPVPGALVCLSDGAGTYARGRTDASGSVTLSWGSVQPGAADLVVSAPDYRVHEGTVTVDPAPGAFLAVTGTAWDDDGTGASSGNGDGALDAGETLELVVDVANAGGSAADSVVVTAFVEAGSRATFDLLYGGVADPARIFVGAARANPDSVPFTLDFAAPALDYTGHPSVAFSPDTALGVPVGDAGIFLWQDREGWHLRWSGASDSVTVSGTVTTDGRVRGASSLVLEAGETLAVAADTLTFSGRTDGADPEDGLDFFLADSTGLSVATPSAALGSLAASASASGTVVLDVASGVRSGQIAAVDLTVSAAVGGPWTGEVRVVTTGPALDAFMFAVEDSGALPLVGNGNGIIEVGETVRLTPTVRNTGTGEAGGVTGTMTAASGITFVDAADAYGAIPSITESAGTDGYVFTVDDSTGTSVDLVLTDDRARTWPKTLEFVAPAAPDSVWFTSTPSRIDVRWAPVDSLSPDVAGYNLYRSATPGTGFTRRNVGLLRSASRFTDAGLTFGSQYYYRVTAVDSSGNESGPSPEILAWTTQVQVSGWPRFTSGFIYPGILMADADGDSLQEIYVGSHDFDFHAWAHDGDGRPGFPLATAFEVWGTAAAADLDGDSDLEIVFGGRDARAYAVHHDGTPVFGATARFLDLSGTGAGIRSAITIADIDSDALFEILIGTDIGTLYAFNHDGTGMADSTGLLFTAAPGNSSASIWGTIAVADLDADGSKEIVFASWNDKVYAIDAAGNVKPGFPRSGANDFRGGVTVGDLDQDGTLEVIAPCFDGTLRVYNHDGSDYVPGGILATESAEFGGGVALANLDADPELEIIVGNFNANLYAYNHDGSSFLPGQAGLFAALPGGSGANDGISATPIVVDVDGDGSFEIFVGHRNHNFYGFRSDGTTLPGMPIPTGDKIFGTAAAGDLDGDGDVDVAFASYDATVNVLDFPGASTPDAYEWATAGGNHYRTALYGDLGPAVDAPVVTAPAWRLVLAQNRPNPFRRSTEIDFSVPRAGSASLKVYNVNGRLVRTLLDGPVAAGAYRLQWDGRDGRGRRQASGIYFYRLNHRDQVLTRKGVLLH